MPAALPIIEAINPITWKWKDSGVDTRRHWGFNAAEIKQATPEGMDWAAYVHDDETGREHMRPDQMIPVLWKAVQELSAELAALRAASGQRNA